jgi:hypothetical protein
MVSRRPVSRQLEILQTVLRPAVGCRAASYPAETIRPPRRSTPAPAAQSYILTLVPTGRESRGLRHREEACPADTSCRQRSSTQAPAAQSYTHSSSPAAPKSPGPRHPAGACRGDTNSRRNSSSPARAELSYTPRMARVSREPRCRAGACLADTSHRPRRSTPARAEPSYIHSPVPRTLHRRPGGTPRGWDLQLRLPRTWLPRGSSSNSKRLTPCCVVQVKR